MLPLIGKSVVVIGGSRGVGRRVVEDAIGDSARVLAVARQEERASSDIDLMVIGEVGFNDVVSSLGEAEKRLGREINPTVYSVEEFRAKRKAKNHFLSTVLRREKLFVIGGQNELARLG